MRLIGSITVLIALTGAALADPTYTLAEARSMVTAAIIAEDKCPGVRFSASKAKAMITASHLDAAEVMDKDEGQRLALPFSRMPTSWRRSVWRPVTHGWHGRALYRPRTVSSAATGPLCALAPNPKFPHAIFFCASHLA